MNSLAIIHMARKELGLDEDTYRALLTRVTGKASLRDMTEKQRHDVVDEFKRKGFVIRAKGKKLPQTIKPYIRLIHALWASCARLGVIETGSRPALRAFCARFIDGGAGLAVDPDLLSYAQASPIIEALKAMEARGRRAAGVSAPADPDSPATGEGAP